MTELICGRRVAKREQTGVNTQIFGLRVENIILELVLSVCLFSRG